MTLQYAVLDRRFRLAAVRSGLPPSGGQIPSRCWWPCSRRSRHHPVLQSHGPGEAQPCAAGPDRGHQCGEVLFTCFGGILFLHDPLPSLLGVFGIMLIVAGMVAGALLGQR